MTVFSVLSWERNIYLMYIYSLFSRFLFSTPVEVVFFSQVAGTYTKAMSLYAIMYTTGTVLGVPLGILADFWGRKKIALLCSFCQWLAYVLYATAFSYPALVLGAVLHGFYRAIAKPNADSLCYETLQMLDKKDGCHLLMSKCKSLALFGLSGGALGCALLSVFSLRLTFIVTCVTVFIAFLSLCFIKEPPIRVTVSKTNPFKQTFNSVQYLFKNKRLLFFITADATWYGFSDASFSFNANFFKTIVPVETLGILRFAGHFFSAIASWCSGFVGQLIGLKKTIYWGAFFNNIFDLFSIILASPFISPILKTLGSTSFGIYSPASCTYLQNEASEKERGTIISIASLLICGIYSLASLFVGMIADLYNPYVALVVSYSIALLAGNIYLLGFYQKQSV